MVLGSPSRRSHENNAILKTNTVGTAQSIQVTPYKNNSLELQENVSVNIDEEELQDNDSVNKDEDISETKNENDSNNPDEFVSDNQYQSDETPMFSEVSIPPAHGPFNMCLFSSDESCESSFFAAAGKIINGKSTDGDDSACLNNEEMNNKEIERVVFHIEEVEPYRKQYRNLSQTQQPLEDSKPKISQAVYKKPAVELDRVTYPTGLLRGEEWDFLFQMMEKKRCGEHLSLNNVANTELVYKVFLKIIKVMYQVKCQLCLTKKKSLPFASSEKVWNLRWIFRDWVYNLKVGNSETDKVCQKKNHYTERQVDMLDLGLYCFPLRNTLSQRYRSILENKVLKQYFEGKSWQNIHDKLRVHCKSKPWENLLCFYDMQCEFGKFVSDVDKQEQAKLG